MPSPLLHSAAGLAICLLDRDMFRKLHWRFAAIMVGAALAPDFDIIAGFLVNHPNLFHRGWSHSIGAAVLAGALITLFTGRAIRRLGLLVTLGVCSHLALDIFAVDNRVVNGIPLLWPLSSRQVAGSPVFGAFEHGGDYSPPIEFLQEVLSPGNLVVLGIEMLFAAPALAICWYLGRLIEKRSKHRETDWVV